MPTIEIASVGATDFKINPDEFTIALEIENKLISHRGLFYDFLLPQKGVIIHLGNPYFKDDREGGFFADALIDWSYSPEYLYIPVGGESGAGQEEKFKFQDEYRGELNRLLELAIQQSPNRLVYFLTDYQFGPKEGTHEKFSSIEEFWKKHDLDALVLNTLFEISG